jgi:hypothetical protein
MNTNDDDIWKMLYDKALNAYNEAYYNFVFCPEWEKDRAQIVLQKCRSVWFNI